MLENMSQIHDLRVLLLACLCLVVKVQGADYGATCNGTGLGDCTPNLHLKCDTTCKCDDNYVRDADAHGGAACKLKVGQTCIGTDATVCVSYTTCTGSKCTCLTGYKPGTGSDLGLCVETYDSACTTANVAADCTNSLAHSTCTNSMCKCANGYKLNTVTPKACKAIIDMACTADTDCNVMGVSNAECTGTPKMCKCMNGYYGATCTKIIGEKVCTADADCNAGTNALKYSRCSSLKCECLATAIEQNDICKLKVDQNCTANTDYCPTNAECTGTPTTKCTCKANYTPKDGMCEVENAGMTVKISMMLMVAALISIFLQ